MQRLTLVVVVVLCMFFSSVEAKPSQCGAIPVSPGKIERVLFVGNSITFKPPVESVGWNGYWGMAATQADRDYKHQLQLMITSRQGSIPEIGTINADIHLWPNRWPKKPTLPDGRSVAEFAPDLVVAQMGDNAPLDAPYEVWLAAYSDIAAWSPAALHIAVGKWGGRPGNDQESYIYRAAMSTCMKYVQIHDLHTPEHEATQYSDRAVAWHPNDTGMMLIAERIATTLFGVSAGGTVPPTQEWKLLMPLVGS